MANHSCEAGSTWARVIAMPSSIGMLNPRGITLQERPRLVRALDRIRQRPNPACAGRHDLAAAVRVGVSFPRQLGVPATWRVPIRPRQRRRAVRLSAATPAAACPRWRRCDSPARSPACSRSCSTASWYTASARTRASRLIRSSSILTATSRSASGSLSASLQRRRSAQNDRAPSCGACRAEIRFLVHAHRRQPP